MFPDDYKWHFDYVRLAWDAGFSFDKYKYPSLDKNKICLVDIERIIKERDVASVERFLPTVVQYMLENDQAELLDTNFVKMFRISQLSVEYLLFCKKYLDNTVVLLKKEISKFKEENRELKLFTEELEGHISTLTKESFVSAFKCDKCPKVFATQEYLSSHSKRRHSNENKSLTSPETDQLQSEIKQLKERLNVTEKLLQEKEDKTENIKLDVVEDENKFRVNEILEKFERFKDKVENDLKTLQMEKNFYEEKYSKLFEAVLESTKEPPKPVRKDQQEKGNVKVTVDMIERTTQTDIDVMPIKELQTETAPDKDLFVVTDVDPDFDIVRDKKDIQDTLKQKISEFEEQIEIKITSSLGNIESQMQAFWGKLSEIEIQRNQQDHISAVQEIASIKPQIKPRMKFSKPTKLGSDHEETANKIKEEVEKMGLKAENATVLVKGVPKSNNIKIPDLMFDSTSESEKISGTERKSESESSKTAVSPKRIRNSKSSSSARKKRPVARSQKAIHSKENTEKVREDVSNAINRRLQDIGISSNWKGIPHKTFEKALEIVRHRASRSKKLYPDYDSVKKSIEELLSSKKETMQQTRNRLNYNSKKGANVINISYRRKPKETESETDTKSIVSIRNRSLYNTDSDGEDPHLPKPSEAVPAYAAVIRELHTSQRKIVDSDADTNSVVLPKNDTRNEPRAKSALRSYASLGSLTKKKVIFDVENEVEEAKEEETRGSLISIDSSDLVEDVEVGKQKKNGSSASDFDLSEL